MKKLKPLIERCVCLAIRDRERLDNMTLNFGFRRLPIADLPYIYGKRGLMKTEPKYQSLPKKKKIKKVAITAREYRRMQVTSVDASLDQLFGKRPKSI